MKQPSDPEASDQALFDAAFELLERGEAEPVSALLRRFPTREVEVRKAVHGARRYQEWLQPARPPHRLREPAPRLEPGASLGGFQLISLLGEGGMGRVYRARQEALEGREVALKVIAAELAEEDPRFVERFRREASLAAEIHHPNVAEVYDFGEEQGLSFFAMRLVEGRTLLDVLAGLAQPRRAGTIEITRIEYVRRVVVLVRDLAAGLAAIHEHGLVHRDVKHSNIVLEGAGSDEEDALQQHPVLVDFGLLRSVGHSDLTGADTVLGTAAFSAPEVRLGEDIDARADVFALGAVLYDLLALVGPGERALAAAGLQDVRLRNPGVDARLAAVVSMALERRAALRYADGAEIRDELDAYLGNRPIRALPTSALGRLRLWARRNPVRAVKASVAGLLATVLAAFLLLIAGRTLSIYFTAGGASSHERDGDLLDAARAYREILDQRFLASWLPGLGKDLNRARAYWPTAGLRSDLLPRAWRQLEDGTPEGLKSAHDSLLHYLSTNPPAPLEEAILGFLVRGLEQDIPQDRRIQAARTLAHYLLVVLHGPDARADELPWRKMVEAALVRASRAYQGQADDVLSVRCHVACALGSTGMASLDALAGDFEADDPELRRVALTAANRHFRRLILKHQETGKTSVQEVDQQLLARVALAMSWATGGDAGPAYNVLEHLALIRSHLADANRLDEWGVEKILLDKIDMIRPREFDAGSSLDVYRNTWDLARPMEGGDAESVGDVDASSSAILTFTESSAVLEGRCASEFHWSGATLYRTPSGVALQFDHPGRSEARLSIEVAEQTVSARLQVVHHSPERAALPGGHGVPVEFSIAGDEYRIIQHITAKDGRHAPHDIPIPARLLAGRDSIEVKIRVLDAPALYWLYRLEVVFKAGD